MPYVEPKQITDLPRTERKRAEELFFERALLQYGFSYRKLHDLLASYLTDKYGDVNESMIREHLAACIIAWNDKEQKEYTSNLNEKITDIYTENGIDSTLRYVDPFGRPKDYILIPGTSVSFSAERALPIAVAGVYEWTCPKCDLRHFTLDIVGVHCDNEKCVHNAKDGKPIKKANGAIHHKMTAEAFSAIVKLATKTTHYVTIQARDVKTEKSEKSEKPKKKG